MNLYAHSPLGSVFPPTALTRDEQSTKLGSKSFKNQFWEHFFFADKKMLSKYRKKILNFGWNWRGLYLNFQHNLVRFDHTKVKCKEIKKYIETLKEFR